MFESKFAYPIKSPIRKSRNAEDGEELSYLYKVRTNSKKSYFIKVSIYENNVHFIKFFPSKLEQANDKYKRRLGNVNEFSRLISTCLKLAIKLFDNNPDSIFGFHGQWDRVDVKKNSEVSQRYKIYKKAVVSVLSKSDRHQFNFYPIDQLNSFFVVPQHLNFEAMENKLKKQFSKILGDEGLNELQLPNQR